MINSSASEYRESERFSDYGAKGGDDAIDIRNVIITLRKYKWPILLFTSIATAITALVVSSITPQFRAASTLMMDTSGVKTGFESQFDGFGRSKEELQTQVEVVKSRTLAERVAIDLDLKSHWEYNDTLPIPDRYRNFGPVAPVQRVLWKVLPNERRERALRIIDENVLATRVVRRLMRRTQVFPVKNTNLVKVVVVGADREMAAKIANGIANGFIDFLIERSRGRNTQAREFLEVKVDDLKTKYEASEKKLLEERIRVGVQGDGSDFMREKIGQITNRLLDAKSRLEDARIRWSSIRRVKAENPGAGEVTFEIQGGATGVANAFESLPVVDSNPLVQRNRQTMQEARRKLDELSNRYGAKHPRVIDATSNLQTARANLNRQISNVVASVENEFLSARRLVQSIQQEIQQEEDAHYSLAAGKASIEEFNLTRNQSKILYEEALSDLRDYQERNLATVPMRVSDLAAVPGGPFKPKKTLMVMLGFLLSLLGISSVLFLYESLKESVQGIQDIEQKLGIPVFGIVPVVKSGFLSKKTIPLLPGEFEDTRGLFKEAIRTIRTGATMADLENNNQVIMVTSSVPGEGKSTLSSNFAYSLSKLENVVLVEADMRRPGLGKALGMRSQGLSELLTGDEYLEDCVRINAIGNLDIIPAGRIPATHLELLASPEFSELIDLLKSRYDRVVIDLAPVQAVSDALVVGKYVDSAIYVVKADSTPLPVVRRGVERLQEVGVKVSGAVISQVDLAKVASYGGDYYYQGYYDYYGYGEKDSRDYKNSNREDNSEFVEYSRRAESREAESRREAKKISNISNRRDKSTYDQRMDPSMSMGDDSVA